MNPWEHFRRYAESPTRHVIGLMSGTSVDGVDAALVRLSGSGRETKAELLRFITHPFPAELRQKVLSLCHGEGNAETVSQTAVRLGRLFADASEALLAAASFPRAELDAIASHGQTISHTALPSGIEHQDAGKVAATFQIGESAIIAERLGVPVIADFRTADMASGGQGAPLVPYVDWCLLTHPGRRRAIQNIGGIGNVTYLPASGDPKWVLGFDTGPGNMLIDQAVFWATAGVRRCDVGGRRAAAGTVLPDLLESLLNHPFLLQEPPKSAGREEFGEGFFTHSLAEHNIPFERADDVIATMTAFTAYSIADAYQRFLPALPDEVIVGGGGSKNSTLMRMLSERLSPIPVLPHEDVGINSDAKEAIAFAILANETLLGNPSNLPSVTGAKRPVIQGKITLP